jgi:N-methylhydantoinase A
MVAFGGAAPLHAARLCEKLGISNCLIPQGAGVGSAIGFLRAPFSFEANNSVFMPLSEFDPAAVKELFADMEREASAFVRSCDQDAKIKTVHKIYMRYAGQGWEIPVPLASQHIRQPDASEYKACFEQAYEQLFARIVAGMEIEITVWSVNAYTEPPQAQPVQPPTHLTNLEPIDSRPLFDPALSAFVTAAVAQRDAMEGGAQIKGPALLTEDETTIIISSTRNAVACGDGTIMMFAKQSGDQT